MTVGSSAKNPDEGPGVASRPEILYVAHRLPYPPDKGDRIRTFHVLRSLSSRAAVHLACLADEEPDDAAVDSLRRYCERIAVVRLGRVTRGARTMASLVFGGTATEGAFGNPSLRRILRLWAGETRFTAALASSSGVAQYLRIEELREIPAVVDLMDVDSQKWLDYAATTRGPRSWLYGIEGSRMRRLEAGLSDSMSALTLVTEAEADIYRRFRPDGPVHAIPNGVDQSYFRPDPPEAESGCVFVGAFDYRPNVDGACWFCREAWPGILDRSPGVRLALVGRRPSPVVRGLARLEGVDVVGEVPDVRPYLAGAAVVLAPLRIARGVQNKVLEALAMGKAVVASPQALEGLNVDSGVHLLVASTPEDWSNVVTHLLETPDLRRRLGESGRRYIEENHQWDRCLEPFARLLGLPARALEAGRPLVSERQALGMDDPCFQLRN
ncbi:TIGR03087 family PEP-CTERM/XrtA system glycosyltransferase (plasmid) [Tundrisphaera lichenicola]|uniref:TIGR03087 family PEP-CTERM/XrtA system glycosyltransferase n=1 Tax=Tundrisphaera lichenicola TaxID=2029860 RepID=UPI003EBF0E98